MATLCKCSRTFHVTLHVILTQFMLDLTISGREGKSHVVSDGWHSMGREVQSHLQSSDTVTTPVVMSQLRGWKL